MTYAFHIMGICLFILFFFLLCGPKFFFLGNGAGTVDGRPLVFPMVASALVCWRQHPLFFRRWRQKWFELDISVLFGAHNI